MFYLLNRKKREAYRGSEFAPRILADHGIPVVMKVRLDLFLTLLSFVQKKIIQNQSDHPVVNSRYLLFEAQQAHYYGLNPALALASVTSTPARAAGMDHRVGTIAEGLSFDTSYPPYQSLTFATQDTMLVRIHIYSSNSQLDLSPCFSLQISSYGTPTRLH